jgi:hypothetical protein
MLGSKKQRYDVESAVLHGAGIFFFIGAAVPAVRPDTAFVYRREVLNDIV